MTLSARLEAARAATATSDDPCFCDGPFLSLEPADRPETPLSREHDLGSTGCNYAGASEWRRRRARETARRGRVAYVDLTGR